MTFYSNGDPSKEISDFQFKWDTSTSTAHRARISFSARILDAECEAIVLSLSFRSTVRKWGWDFFSIVLNLPIVQQPSTKVSSMNTSKVYNNTPNQNAFKMHNGRNEFRDYVNSHRKFHFKATQPEVVNYRRQSRIHQKNEFFESVLPFWMPTRYCIYVYTMRFL